MHPSGGSAVVIAFDAGLGAGVGVDTMQCGRRQHPGQTGAMLHPQRRVTGQCVETVTGQWTVSMLVVAAGAHPVDGLGTGLTDDQIDGLR